jgi:hypothetical protein
VYLPDSGISKYKNTKVSSTQDSRTKLLREKPRGRPGVNIEIFDIIAVDHQTTATKPKGYESSEVHIGSVRIFIARTVDPEIVQMF